MSSDLLRLVEAQAEDEGLWFVAETAPEAYLQQELRRLHAAVEGAELGGGVTMIDVDELTEKAVEAFAGFKLRQGSGHTLRRDTRRMIEAILPDIEAERYVAFRGGFDVVADGYDEADVLVRYKEWLASR